MENLIQLVADSFARHGLESLPAADRNLVEPGTTPALPPFPESLPQHSFGKSPAQDLAP